MLKQTLSIVIILTMMISAHGQVFVDQIKVGQKMPDQINPGGFSEENVENCACRIFSIKYNVSQRDMGGGGATLTETIGVHHNSNDTVKGVINIKLRMNNEDAQKVYNSRLSEYMRTQSYFKDRQIVKVRDSNNGVVDGIYYFIYSYENGKKYKAIGVVEKAIIEETYVPNSSYEPRLIN